MGTNRKIPFGYEMKNGQAVEHPREAAVVRHIFDAYLAGKSLQKIADALNQTTIHYSVTAGSWDKNRVRRVLENSRYCGETHWPALIPMQQFSQAKAMRGSKAASPTQGLSAVRKRIQCEACGSTRYLDLRKKPNLFWLCRACNHRAGPIAIETLLEKIEQKLQWLTQHPDWICAPRPAQHGDMLAVARISREIDRALEQPQIPSEEIARLLMQRASAQYSLCDAGDGDPMTLQLQEIVRQSWPENLFCKQVFENAVDAVLMDFECDIQVRLINGQIL